jgi:hypothetical protein
LDTGSDRSGIEGTIIDNKRNPPVAVGYWEILTVMFIPMDKN